MCVGLYDGHEVAIIPRSLLGRSDYAGPDFAWPELLEELALWDLELHNGLFDIPTLTARLAEEGTDPESYGVRVGFDTMLSHYALRPGSEQGLKPLSKSLLGVDDWDQLDGFQDLSQHLFEHREDWWKHAWPVMDAIAEEAERSKKMEMTALGTYPELLVQLYNGYDVLHTWMLRDFLEPYIAHHDEVAQASRHLHEFANLIMWDQLDGFPVDTDRGEQLVKILSAELSAHEDQLVQWAGAYTPEGTFPGNVFNPRSPKQVRQLYAHVGHKLAKTDEKTMEHLVKKGDKFAAKLLEYRGVLKELRTYAVKATESTNSVLGEPRMFPWYNLTSTLTGRLSSSGVTNIQNWPKQEGYDEERKLRSVFVASSLGQRERTLLQVDYSQAELRVLAAVAEDDWLTSIFSDPDVDIFTQMTHDIWPGIEADQVKLKRRPLKATVYGLLFARQAPAIAADLGIPIKEAQRIMDTFLEMADEVDAFRQHIMHCAATGEPIVTRFGRRFHHEIITGRNKHSVQRSALSFIPQSTASDITLTAYMRLREELRACDRDWKFRALVHDAITYDVPLDEVGEATAFITKHMTEAAKLVVPEVPFAVDGNHSRVWSQTG